MLRELLCTTTRVELWLLMCQIVIDCRPYISLRIKQLNLAVTMTYQCLLFLGEFNSV